MPKKRFDSRRARSGNGNAIQERRILAAEVLAQARIRNRPAKEGGSECPILVEGKRDKSALRTLGFEGPIELVNRGWTLERLAGWFSERLEHRNPIDGKESIILMMDWDRTGGRLQNELNRRLKAFDISIDEYTRKMLIKALKPETRVVESLHGMADELLPLLAEIDPDGKID